ncbi:MAG: DUF4922 domain-containing protein [Ignavibacteriaceae bacterium]
MNETLLLKNNLIDKFITDNEWCNAVKFLLEDQKISWNMAADGYESLQTVETKEFQFEDFRLRVQFNPKRIISTSAKVDDASIEERKCFLCHENLPAEQKGILYRNNYLILCNPFPIFPEHFTIPKIEHTPQEIQFSFEILLSLSKDLSDNYTVFYNGPKCGASAPDHLHFQAGNKFFMPIDSDYENMKKKFGEIIFVDERINIIGIDDGLRRFITFESADAETIMKYFKEFYSTYKFICESKEEPKMNILCFFGNRTGWRIIFFLREKHRPSHYFANEKDKILLSPAAVDVGGVCITPIEKDFELITKDILIEIFNEIFFDKNNFKYLNRILREKFNRK